MKSPPARPSRASSAGTGDRSDATKGVGGRVLSTPSSHEPVAHRRLCTTSPRRHPSTGASSWRPVLSGGGLPGRMDRRDRPVHQHPTQAVQLPARQARGCHRCGRGVRPRRAPWEPSRPERRAARWSGRGIDGLQAPGCTDRYVEDACDDVAAGEPPRAPPAGAGGRSGAAKGAGGRVLSTTSSHDPGREAPRVTGPRRRGRRGLSRAGAAARGIVARA
jgi:hypothetical protein